MVPVVRGQNTSIVNGSKVAPGPCGTSREPQAKVN
jgi:hypothetical protein